MSTKSLLTTTTVLIFLAGWAFGFSLGDMRGASKLVPTNERERAFYDNWQAARLSTSTPGDNFRVAVTTYSHDYAFSVSESARAVARGATVETIASATDARIGAVIAPFNPVFNKQIQAEHSQLWKTLTNALFQYGSAKTTSATSAATSEATIVLTNTAAQMAQFYTTHGVNVSATVLQSGFSRAFTKFEQSIDTTNGGSLLTSLQTTQQAAQELGNTMDMVASGIVTANPSDFK